MHPEALSRLLFESESLFEPIPAFFSAAFTSFDNSDVSPASFFCFFARSEDLLEAPSLSMASVSFFSAASRSAIACLWWGSAARAFVAASLFAALDISPDASEVFLAAFAAALAGAEAPRLILFNLSTTLSARSFSIFCFSEARSIFPGVALVFNSLRASSSFISLRISLLASESFSIVLSADGSSFVLFSVFSWRLISPSSLFPSCLICWASSFPLAAK